MCLYNYTKYYIYMDATHERIHILGRVTWDKLRQKRNKLAGMILIPFLCVKFSANKYQ